MPIEVLVTSERALGDKPDATWVRRVLEAYPLDSALLFYTRILHQIEIASDPLKAALDILPTIARDDTVTGVLDEARQITNRGRRPGIFIPLLLTNILKEAICRCAAPPGPLTLQNRDQLFRAYLATHDHFQDALVASARPKEELLKEEVLRQVLVGLGDQVALTLPRYWAIWVTIPKRLGVADQLVNFMPAELPRPMSAVMIPLLSLWAFFSEQARSQNARPVVLDTQGWNPAVLTAVSAVMKESVLDADLYKKELEAERASLRANERWEYSRVTPSRWPLIRIGDAYFCISLALLANTFCDGLYHRMLTGCRGDQAKVNAFTECFGNLFHEYTYDL